jgi:hypothetical protein
VLDGCSEVVVEAWFMKIEKWVQGSEKKGSGFRKKGPMKGPVDEVKGGWKNPN